MAFDARWVATGVDPTLSFRAKSRSFTIDWGDGTSERVVLQGEPDQDGFYQGTSEPHRYASRTGAYNVTVSQGDDGAFKGMFRAVILPNDDQPVLLGRDSSDDYVVSGSGSDFLDVRRGNDVVYAGAGDDIARAGGRRERAHSLSSDHDMLYGGSGDDNLSAGYGDDRIQGDSGSDRLRGGTGADTFVFVRPLSGAGPTNAKDHDRDTILDFRQGEDKIDVSDWSHDFIFMGTGGPGRTGHPSIFYGPKDYSEGTVIFGDVDGDGSVDFFIRLVGHFVLTESDFII